MGKFLEDRQFTVAPAGTKRRSFAMRWAERKLDDAVMQLDAAVKLGVVTKGDALECVAYINCLGVWLQENVVTSMTDRNGRVLVDFEKKNQADGAQALKAKLAAAAAHSTRERLRGLAGVKEASHD
jgi:hypothetical protein